MYKYLIILVTLFFIACGSDDESKVLLEDASKKLFDNDFFEAKKSYEAALKVAIDKEPVFKQMLDDYIAAGNYQAVIDQSKFAKTQFPENAYWNYTCGLAWFYSNEPPQAINESDEGFQLLKPGETDLKCKLYRLRGSANQNIAYVVESMADLKEADKLCPGDLKTVSALSVTFFQNEKQDSAVYFAEKAIGIDSTFALGYSNLGYFLSQMGQHEKAIQNLDKAIELDGELSLAYNNRGYSRLKLGELQIAKDDIDRSLTLYPENPYAFKNRALWKFNKNDIDGGCLDLKHAIELGYPSLYENEVVELNAKYCK